MDCAPSTILAGVYGHLLVASSVDSLGQLVPKGQAVAFVGEHVFRFLQHLVDELVGLVNPGPA